MGRVRIERLEHPIEDVRRHPSGGVSEPYMDGVWPRLASNPYISLASPLNCFQRVLREVCDNQLEELSIPHHINGARHVDRDNVVLRRPERVSFNGIPNYPSKLNISCLAAYGSFEFATSSSMLLVT